MVLTILTFLKSSGQFYRMSHGLDEASYLLAVKLRVNWVLQLWLTGDAVFKSLMECERVTDILDSRFLLFSKT